MELLRTDNIKLRAGYIGGNWVWLVDLALIGVFAIVLRGPVLSVSVFETPSTWDESAFILAAREVLLGHLPYLTFWDHKPFGSTMLIASVMAIFGQSIETVCLFALAGVVATAWSLYAITRRILPDRSTALSAALLYIAFSTQLGGIQLMTENLQATFAAAGVLILMSAPGQRGAVATALTFAAAGLAFGVATWIKYVPAIPATSVGGFVLITFLRRPGRTVARTAAFGAVFAVGLLLPTLASVLLYWQAGILDEFLHANFGFARRYIEHTEHLRGATIDRLRWASVAVVQVWPLMAATAAAFLPQPFRYFSEPSRRWGSAVVVLWLVGELAALCLQARFFDHQFLSVLPPMSIAAAGVVRFCADRLALPARVAATSALIIALLALIPLVHHARDMSAALFRQDVPRSIAQVIKDEMAPGDQVYVANYAPIIYVLADTLLPTRHAFPGFLVGSRVLVDDVPAERLRVLRNRPKYIVMHEAWRNDLPAWNAQALTQVEETLAQDYAPRAAWTLHDARGIVRLFVRRD